ncbi:MAG: MotA/TolQ/ExbB proton channel family protein [Solitalea-like symbiont of Acarus siro]
MKNSGINSTITSSSKFNSTFASLAIVICIVVAILLYTFVLGHPSNFEGNNPANNPVSGGFKHFMGLIYKGGYIVPILIGMVLINLTVAIERYLTISGAVGKGSLQSFVLKIRSYLHNNNIEGAINECDNQQGALANVTRSGLISYQEVTSNPKSSKEQKEIVLKKEIEEATNLELPMLEKNLVITATLASGSTLVALLGTVLGMIKAFAALGAAGGGDQMALSIGISEALINTALGIGNAALATFLYAYFTSKIDTITYAIDETSYSIEQTFAKNNS